MIAAMLAHLKSVLPDDRPVLVLADRGIGTSPALCKAVAALGWHYLFRVVKTVKVKTERGKLSPYAEIKKGGRWAASGIVFITQGQDSRAYSRDLGEGLCRALDLGHEWSEINRARICHAQLAGTGLP